MLISSTEHYGAVLNLDFDFRTYLDTLKADGLNLTRTFSGVYCEDPKSFNIRDNTLAPAAGRYIAPWARSESPGYSNGGNKFDLTKWDAAYFRRLKEFLRQADRRGIVVEFVLFCPFYEETMWHLSPMYAANNVNGIGDFSARGGIHAKHADLQRVQDEFRPQGRRRAEWIRRISTSRSATSRISAASRWSGSGISPM